MSKLFFKSTLFHLDSLSGNSQNQDTNEVIIIKENNISSSSLPEESDIVSKNSLPNDTNKYLHTGNNQNTFKEHVPKNNLPADTLPLQEKYSDSSKQFILKEPINLFNFKNSRDSFDYKHSKVFIEHIENSKIIEKNLLFSPHFFHKSQLNWTLFIGLISVTLILSIKANYQKFLNQILNTTINFQLADKMFHEKNILLRRAFFMLNINFVLIFSLFIMLLSVVFEIELLKSRFLGYLLILLIFISILIIRYLIFYTSGLLFNKQTVVSEYLHNKYLINKNIGLGLIPVVFTSIFTSVNISKILLTSACILIVIVSFIKIFRGFQIILKNGVLLFYTILYLCTLELLPLVLGSKILISLR